MDIKEFAQKFIEAHKEAWLKGDFQALENLEDPGIVFHSIASGRDSIVGWDDHKRQIQQGRHAFSGYYLEYQYLAGEGTLFVLSQKSGGVATAQVTRMKPGIQAAFNYMYVFRVDKGRIAEVWYAGTATYT